jgi:MoaA/NifB/PqqE/SkfB family radical SAM enzyme
MGIRERLNKVQKLSPEVMTETPPIPRSVKIELTSRCNYNCVFCGYSTRKVQPQADMDFGLFRRITSEMKDIGVEEIGPFLIGEPFINPGYVTKAVRWLKHDLEFPYVFLTSNASLAHPKHVAALMAAGLDSLKWSVNSADIEQFTQMTGRPEKFWKLALENIKSAKKVRDDGGYATKLYASSIHYDDSQSDKAKAYLEENILPFVDEHYWLPLYTMGGQANSGEKGAGLAPTAGNMGQYSDPVPPIPCWTLFTAGHILVDGRMTACCADANGIHVVGDLKTQSFVDAWHSDSFKEIRRAHLLKDISNTKCVDCLIQGR